MSSNLKIDLDNESEKLRNEMINANTLEEILSIEKKIKELELKSNKFVESLNNNKKLEAWDINLTDYVIGDNKKSSDILKFYKDKFAKTYPNTPKSELLTRVGVVITIQNHGKLEVDESFSTKLKIETGGTLDINSGFTLTETSNGGVTNEGEINNYGTITLQSTITNSGEINNEGSFNCVGIVNSGEIINGSPNLFINSFNKFEVSNGLVNQSTIKNYGKIITKNIGLPSGEVRNEYTGTISISGTVVKTDGILASYSKIDKLTVDTWLYSFSAQNSYMVNSALCFDLQLNKKALNNMDFNYEILSTSTATNITPGTSGTVSIVKDSSVAKINIPLSNISNNLNKTIDIKFTNLKNKQIFTGTITNVDFNLSGKSTNDIEIKKGQTFTVNDDFVLSKGNTLNIENSGILEISSGKTFTDYGTTNNNGTITINGTMLSVTQKSNLGTISGNFKYIEEVNYSEAITIKNGEHKIIKNSSGNTQKGIAINNGGVLHILEDVDIKYDKYGNIINNGILINYGNIIYGNQLTNSGSIFNYGNIELGSTISVTNVKGNKILFPNKSDYVLTVDDSSVNEGDDGDNNMLTFNLSLDYPAGRDITINYYTKSTGSATNDDFKIVTDGTVVIRKGSTEASVNIEVKGDTIAEDEEETFEIEFFGNEISRVIATGTIVSEEIKINSYKSPLQDGKYYIIEIENSGKTNIKYYDENGNYGRRVINTDLSTEIYNIDENGQTKTEQSIVDDETLSKILEVGQNIKEKVKKLDEKQKKASTNVKENAEQEAAKRKVANKNANDNVTKELKFALSPDNGFCQINSNEKTYTDANNISNKKEIVLGPVNKNVDGTDYPLTYSLLSNVEFQYTTINQTNTGTTTTKYKNNYPRFKYGNNDWLYDNTGNNKFFLKLEEITRQIGSNSFETNATNKLQFANWAGIFSNTQENKIEIEHAFKVKYKDPDSATDTERIGFIGITLIKKEDVPPKIINIEKPIKMVIGDNNLKITVDDVDNKTSDITLSIENLNEDLGTITFDKRENKTFHYIYNLQKNIKDHAMIEISVTSNKKTVKRKVKLDIIEDKIPQISLTTDYTIDKYKTVLLRDWSISDDDNEVKDIEIIITEEPKFGEVSTIYQDNLRAFSYRNTSIPSSISDKKFTDTFKLKAKSGRSESEEKTVTININSEDSVPSGSAQFKVNFLN